MSATLYGISNCDTVKKARRWLDQHAVEYRFHDLRKDGITARQIQQWLDGQGLERVLNKRGTTWRQLPQEVQNSVAPANAAALLEQHPTLIKRPVLEYRDQTRVGFKPADYEALFLS
ncbi:MAG: ArsC family reductase [Pseudomonadota bacterium]|mgnify:CR=1 FL=1|nr:ArsC family reductase [Pseudomonadales bacterium]MDY6920429.1 ArsC family reductase [Pseudomonadota bacterium]